MQPILIKIENLYNSPRKVSQLETFFQLPSVTLEFLPSFSKRNYFSPFNLVFIHQLSSWEVFQQKENVFIARDGLLDLVSFFIKSPHPPLQNKSIIMFPKEFSAFIPDAWKEISLAYGYRSTRKTYLEKSLNLIGVGHLDLDAIDKDKTKVFLNKIKIEKSKGYLLIDDSSPRYGQFSYGARAENLKIKKEFLSNIPEDVCYVDEREILSIGCDSTWRFINLDSPFLIYDRWSDHFFSGLGAGQTSENNQKAVGSLLLPINSFESMIVSGWEETTSEFNEIYMNYKLLNINHKGFYRVFKESIKHSYLQRRKLG